MTERRFLAPRYILIAWRNSRGTDWTAR